MAIRILSRVTAVIGAIALAGQSIFAASPDAGGAVPTTITTTGGNWWNAQNQNQASSAPGMSRQTPDDLTRAPYRPYASSILDYPGMQMNDWVTATAMAARSKVMLERAQSELSAIIRRQQQRFERSKEFVEATAAQKQSYEEYAAIRQRAIASLARDARYSAISQLRDELGNKIESRRRAKDVAREELVAMATLKLQYASDARVIEVSELAANPELRAARDRMLLASRIVSELRTNFEFALPDQPEVLVARRNLADAQVTVVEAHALASAAGISSSYALNYAYFLHRNDNGGTFGAYGPNGVYGAGYSSPYWGR